MGGSDALCEVSRIGDEHSMLNFQCMAGVISTTAVAKNTEKPIFEAGVLP